MRRDVDKNAAQVVLNFTTPERTLYVREPEINLVGVAKNALQSQYCVKIHNQLRGRRRCQARPKGTPGAPKNPFQDSNWAAPVGGLPERCACLSTVAVSPGYAADGTTYTLWVGVHPDRFHPGGVGVLGDDTAWGGIGQWNPATWTWTYLGGFVNGTVEIEEGAAVPGAPVRGRFRATVVAW